MYTDNMSDSRYYNTTPLQGGDSAPYRGLYNSIRPYYIYNILYNHAKLTALLDNIIVGKGGIPS